MGVVLCHPRRYIKQNFQEQILRDARISALWEGTTGIQALDLLGRKIMQHGKMRPIKEHCARLYVPPPRRSAGRVQWPLPPPCFPHVGVAGCCFPSRSEAFKLMTSGSSTSVKRHALSIFTHALEWQVLTMRVGMKAMKNADAIGVASYDYLMCVAIQATRLLHCCWLHGCAPLCGGWVGGWEVSLHE